MTSLYKVKQRRREQLAEKKLVTKKSDGCKTSKCIYAPTGEMVTRVTVSIINEKLRSMGCAHLCDGTEKEITKIDHAVLRLMHAKADKCDINEVD